MVLFRKYYSERNFATKVNKLNRILRKNSVKQINTITLQHIISLRSNKKNISEKCLSIMTKLSTDSSRSQLSALSSQLSALSS